MVTMPFVSIHPEGEKGKERDQSNVLAENERMHWSF
jgi:hypothetical protein